MRQRRVRWGKGESRRTRSFGRCLEFYLRHFTTVPRLRRHCSAVKSRNTQTVLSCDSPRSAADRGESVLKPLSAFLSLVGSVVQTSYRCSHDPRQTAAGSVRAAAGAGVLTAADTAHAFSLQSSFGIRRDLGGIQAGFGGIQVGF